MEEKRPLGRDKMQQRPLRGLALFTVLSLVIAACGGGGTATPATSDTAPSVPGGSQPAGSPDASAPSGEFAPSGDIFAFGVNRAEADEIATERIEYFEELYPDVSLNVSESGFTAEGFLASLASDDPPDVVRMDRNLIPTYVARDLLMPLDECFERSGFDPSLYYEPTISEVTVDDQIYAVPEAMDTRNWLVNTAAFEEAGLDVDDFDFSDWDAIRSANDALLAREGDALTRIGIDPKIPEFVALWAKANGVDLVSADGRTSQLEDPAVAEAVQFTVDLINAQGGRDPFLGFRGTWDFFGADNQFATDQVGAHPMEQWYLNVLTDSPEAPITVKPFMDREGNPITLQGGSGLAITDVAPNPDAACAFVTAMAATEAWTRAAEERARLSEEEGGINTGTFPANSEANEMIFSDIVDVEALPETFRGAVEAVLANQENAFSYPPSPANVTIFFGDTSIVATAVARVLDGEDAATVLAEADTEAQAAIDQALGQ